MMNPRVQAVQPLADYTLLLEFTNGEIRIFDMKPYLDKGIFSELRDHGYFNAVRSLLGSITWPRGQDLCPDTLYEESQPASEEESKLFETPTLVGGGGRPDMAQANG